MAEGETEARLLIRDLNKVPVELRRKMSGAIRKAGQPIVADAKGRASWSSRIPGAISIRSRFTGRSPGISIRVSAKRAPHARAYEGITQQRSSSYFRHPVFGNREVWVSQPTRPFLLPAGQAHGPQVVAAVAEAIDVSARLHGWR